MLRSLFLSIILHNRKEALLGKMAYISIENVQNGLKSLVMSENKKYSKMIYTYQKSIGMIELNTLSLHNF